MWKSTLSFFFAFMFFTASAQEKTYEINGERLQLQKEVEGPLTLLWNTIDNQYRYFIEKDGKYAELVNTRSNGEYQEEYKETLRRFTEDADIQTDKVKLVLYSLRDFANKYNQTVDSEYTFTDKRGKLITQLGVFGGLSNNIYTNNPENVLAPVLGVELELIDPNLSPRHSAFFHLRHTAAKSDYSYTSVQLSLNYRFKFINKDTYKIHLDTELVNLYYSEETIDITNEEGAVTGTADRDGISLKTPISFGLGTDIRILPNGFLTFSYNDFVSLVLKDNGEFPVDFTIGYKMTL